SSLRGRGGSVPCQPWKRLPTNPTSWTSCQGPGPEQSGAQVEVGSRPVNDSGPGPRDSTRLTWLNGRTCAPGGGYCATTYVGGRVWLRAVLTPAKHNWRCVNATTARSKRSPTTLGTATTPWCLWTRFPAAGPPDWD